MKKVLFILLSALLLTGCNQNEENQSMNKSLDKIISNGNYVIVDVRTKEEYDQAHIIGAINIPYDEIDQSIALDPSKTILVYCKSGNRSKIAWDALNQLGYTTYDLGAFQEIDLPKE